MKTASLAAGAFALLVARPAQALLTFEPDGRCTAGKLEAAGRRALVQLSCEGTAARKGVPANAECVERAQDGFERGFATAEQKPPCFGTGDDQAVDAITQALVTDLVADLRPDPGADPCAARKLQAAGIKARKYLFCQARAARTGSNLDPSCLVRPDAAFVRAFSNAEAQLSCATIGDQPTIDARLATFIADLMVVVRPRLPSHCTNNNISLVGDTIARKLRCYEQASPVSPSCLSAADDRFADHFGSSGSDCFPFGELGSAQELLDGFVDDAIGAVLPGALNPCAKGKIAATRMAADQELDRCLGKAVGDGLPLDLVCLQAKDDSLRGSFATADSGGGCTTTGDAEAMVARIADLVDDASALFLTPFPPNPPTPTLLTLETVQPGGACGSITTNVAGEGVPGRRDPNDLLSDPNAACLSSANPKPCCTGAMAGHCDEGTTITCGSISVGGGGVATIAETPVVAGLRRRYALSCSDGSDTACAIGSHPGDLPNGVQCSTVGCGATPTETTSPVKVCAQYQLWAKPSGTLNLVTGEVSLTTTTMTTLSILTTTSLSDTACPRCRTTTATTSSAVFASGVATPGIGVCDDDAANTGANCYVFEPAGGGAGLSADCNPDVTGGGTTSLSITTTATTAGATVSDSSGHFCAGQGGNSDCTASGVPQVCCTGTGMGSCLNMNGCFGSSNASGTSYSDTPATCTAISVTGVAAGVLRADQPTPPVGSYGTVYCYPAVSAGAVLSGLVSNYWRLPGPVAVSSKVAFDLD